MYKLDEKGREAAKHYVEKWTNIAFKTGVMSDEERIHCENMVERLYAALGSCYRKA